MGIHGLWKLIDCAAVPTKMEDWMDCSIAVDASVWMVQFEQSRLTSEDEGLPVSSGSHRILVGFLQRILKLLFYGVKPLIVFDGKMGAEKRAEHDRRRAQREKTERNRVIRYMQRTLAAQGFETSKSTLSLLMSEQPSSTTNVSESKFNTSEAHSVTAAAKTMTTAGGGISPPVQRAAKRRRDPAAKRTPTEKAKRTELVSRSSTLSFLQSSSDYLNVKRSGDAVKDSNMVRSSSTSLYFGPRDVLQQHRSTNEGVARTSRSSTAHPPLQTAFTLLSQTSEHSSDVECIEPTASKVWKTTKELSKEIDVDQYIVSSQSQALHCDSVGESEDEEHSEMDEEDGESSDTSVVNVDEDDEQLHGATVVSEQQSRGEDAPPLNASSFGMETHGFLSASSLGAQHVPLHLLELVDLLHALDVPYVISPQEADAQCAWLNKIGIVDAVFTEDSDVVVHGAPVVLRGFFSGEGTVHMYRQQDLVKAGFPRPVLVALAALLQSDYGQGVRGVSGWSAVESLACIMTPSYYLQSGSLDTAVYRVSAALLERWFQLVALREETNREQIETQLELLHVSLLQRAVVLDLLQRKAWKRFELPKETLRHIQNLSWSILKQFTFTAEGNPEEIRHALNPSRTPQPQWSQVRLLASLRGGSFLAERIRMVEAKMQEQQQQRQQETSGKWRQLTLAHHSAFVQATRHPQQQQQADSDQTKLPPSCRLMLISGSEQVIVV